MANIYEEFGTNEDAEKKGRWVPFGDGFSVCLARAGGKNKNYEKVLERKTRSIRRSVQHGTIPAERLEKIIIETYAQCIVMDWKNITTADGTEWPFSVANCIKLLTDLPDVFRIIRDESDDMENYLQSTIEDDSKNS